MSAKNFIETMALRRADSVFRTRGQQDADYVYDFYLKNGWKLWNYLTRNLPPYSHATKGMWNDAEKWLRKYFINECDKTVTDTSPVPRMKSVVIPGPECWANYTICEYNSILEKIDDSLHGNKSESNAERQLKNAVNNAWLFVQVKPGIYNVERHGEYLSETEFNSMLNRCKAIVAKYAAVSTLQTAA